MKILISNDDGYLAPGVRALAETMQAYGEVTCVCPDTHQSAKSMALTFDGALRLTRRDDVGQARMYSVNGTPVDCVKLAMAALFADGKPDLVVSGINHGSNASVNVMYSGTMGVAFEGCSCGVPSIGFSLTTHALDADFGPAMPFIRRIVDEVLAQGLPEGVCLNVNIPAGCTPSGIRRVRAAKACWTDEYARYTDPMGQPFYWLTGQLVNLEPEEEDTDLYALDHGYVSVVPCTLDRTARM